MGAKRLSRTHEIMLVTRDPSDELHEYLFLDADHAREWLSQPFVTDDAYRVALVEVTRRPCCGAVGMRRRLRTMPVSTWLQENTPHAS